MVNKDGTENKMFNHTGRKRLLSKIWKRHQDGIFSPIEMHIAENLTDRILDNKKEFKNIAIVSLTPSPVENLVQKLCPNASVTTHTLSNVNGDMQSLSLEKGAYDLVISTLCLHLIDDLPEHLLSLGKGLIPDGLFIANMLGGDSFYEWKESAKFVKDTRGITGPFADIKDMGSLLQTFKFALPVVDKDKITVAYPSFSDMYSDMRAHGILNLRADRAQSLGHVTRLQKMQKAYIKAFQTENKALPLTIEILTLSGWFPHESQQKPLAPGSAEIGLDEALKKKLQK